MPKATTVVAPGAAPPAARSIERIQAALLTVVKNASQPRAHQRVLQAAGVQLDRAGTALLYQLHLHPDSAPRVTSLAALLGVDTPTVTRKVQQLERDGYVARSADEADRRAIRISLTATGSDALERLMRAKRESLERAISDWTKADLCTLADLLTRLAESTANEGEGPRGY